MFVTVSGTPNPNAMKFTVGTPVGGPATFTPSTAGDDPLASAVVAIEGVTSMFLTADFVTVTKDPVADWATILPAVTAILEDMFS